MGMGITLNGLRVSGTFPVIWEWTEERQHPDQGVLHKWGPESPGNSQGDPHPGITGPQSRKERFASSPGAPAAVRAGSSLHGAEFGWISPKSSQSPFRNPPLPGEAPGSGSRAGGLSGMWEPPGTAAAPQDSGSWGDNVGPGPVTSGLLAPDGAADEAGTGFSAGIPGLR